MGVRAASNEVLRLVLVISNNRIIMAGDVLTPCVRVANVGTNAMFIRPAEVELSYVDWTYILDRCDHYRGVGE